MYYYRINWVCSHFAVPIIKLYPQRTFIHYLTLDSHTIVKKASKAIVQLKMYLIVTNQNILQ